MKKLFTAFLVMYALCSQAQLKLNAYAVKVGNLIGGEWYYKPTERCDLAFTVTNNVITVNDKAHSVYYVYKYDENSNGDMVNYALDESQRKCVLGFRSEGKSNTLIIVYPNISFIYYVMEADKSFD